MPQQQREAGPLSKVRRLLPSRSGVSSSLHHPPPPAFGFLKLRSPCGGELEMAGTLLSARSPPIKRRVSRTHRCLHRRRSLLEAEKRVREKKGEETGVACAADVTDPPLKKLTRTPPGGMERDRRFAPLVSARFSFRERGPSFAWYWKPPQDGSRCCRTPRFARTN